MESLSPYRGQYSYITSRLDKASYSGSIMSLIRAQEDYNADKQKPYLGEKTQEGDDSMLSEFHDYDPYSEIEAEYPRRLEDIDHTHVDKYVDNIVYAILHNSENSVKQYMKMYPTTATLVGNDDEVIEEKDLLLNTDDAEYSQYEIQEAKSKVPYLLRRLHDKSKEIGVHLISMIIAYEKAKDAVYKSNDGKKYKIQVGPRHLLAAGTYMMSDDGNIGAKFDDDANKSNRAFQRGMAWLNSQSETRDDAVELTRCYEILGIDIKLEDPGIYVQSYIDKLVVSYITSNVNYMMRKKDKDIQQVYSSFGFMRNIDKQLRDLPLESMEAYSSVGQMQEVDTVDNAIRIFNDTPNFQVKDKFRLEYVSTEEQKLIDKTCKQFIAYYNYLEHSCIDLKKFYCYDGFFYDRKGSPLVLDMSSYISDPLYSEYALLNSNGYLIACTVDIRTQYCDVFDMCNHLENYINGIDSPQMKWEMLSL